MCFIGAKVTSKISKEQIMFNDVKKDIKKSMIKKEGIKYKVYKDSLGKLTVGIGHLVLPEDNLRFDQLISQAQVEAFFNMDVDAAIWASIDQAKQCGEFEKDFIIALTHVNFQLGIYWYKAWPNTWENLKAGRLDKVIDSVMSSLWNKQTPVRTKAFKQALLVEIAEDNRALPTTAIV